VLTIGAELGMVSATDVQGVTLNISLINGKIQLKDHGHNKAQTQTNRKNRVYFISQMPQPFRRPFQRQGIKGTEKSVIGLKMEGKRKYQLAPQVRLALAIIGTLIVAAFNDGGITLNIMVLLLIFIALSVAQD
jgi:hypothetical protein